MNEIKIKVNFKEKELIPQKKIELVQNDYNSTKFIFEFDVDDSQRKTIQIARKDNDYVIDEITNNEYVIDRRITQVSGEYQFDVCLYGSDDKITSYATGKMFVRNELIDTEQANQEIEEDDRYPILDELISDINTGLATIDSKLGEIDTAIENVDDAIERTEQAIEETNNLDLDVNKVNKTATVELTKKDGTTKSVNVNDGVSLQFMWQGTSLGIKTDDMQDYVFVDLQGVQGIPGPQGEPFRIKKTYSSVAEMNADFDNMEIGDYVMIASSVEVEDNAKLFTRGESQWIFITDFSGATGIKGETGLTPNIQIGTVTSGTTPSVTRTGTNENPIFNFVLVKGDTGETGPKGDTGATGNGIANIEKTSETASEKNFRINYTNGDHFDYSLENGEVTQAQFDELQEELDRYKMLENALPKVNGEGESITMDNTAESPMKMVLGSNGKQETTSGNQLIDFGNPSSINPAVTYSFQNNILIATGEGTYINAQWNITSIYKNNAGKTLKFGFKNLSNVTGSGTIAQLIITYSDETPQRYPTMMSRAGNLTDRQIPSDVSNIQSVMFGIYPNNSSPAQTGSVTIEEPLLYLDNNNTYEPYTGGIASPNPSYPQEIQVVSGDNEVIVGNKNLAKSVFINSTSNAYAKVLFVETDLKPSTTYVISFKGTSGNKLYLNEKLFVINTFFEVGSGRTNVIATTKDELPSNEYTDNRGWAFFKNQSSNTIVGTFDDVLLEYGSTATTYEPHQEQNFTISLGNTEYCKTVSPTISSAIYEDKIFKAVDGDEVYDGLTTEQKNSLVNGKWYKYVKNKKIVITDISQITVGGKQNTGTANSWKLTNIDESLPTNIVRAGYCSHLANNLMGNMYSSVDTVGWNLEGKIFTIRLENSQFPNLQSVKDYAQAQINNGTPITFIVPLISIKSNGELINDKSVFELLNDTLQTQLNNIEKYVKSYQGQTNITQTNDGLPFIIKSTAIKDISNL